MKKLTIVVPKGYTGSVILVLSNVESNILTLDTNGIGYINRATYDATLSKPNILDTDGNNISRQAVGYSSSEFWAIGSFAKVSAIDSSKNIEIKYISFEIVPLDKIGIKQYYVKDLSEVVDYSRLPE